MTTADITFTKGSITVSLFTVQVDEDLSNKIFAITPPQTNSNQSEGPKDTKIVDLLRLTHTYHIRGEITPTSTQTAKKIKDNLLLIAKGANENGGEITMTYEGDSVKGYIEKVVVSKKSQDAAETYYSDDDIGVYTATIDFIKGISI